MDNRWLVIIWLISLIVMSYPFWGLFGFFESRKDGEYKFRAKRFLIVSFCVVFLGFLVRLCVLVSVKNSMDQGVHIAEFAVLKSRAMNEYAANNLSVMFSETFFQDKKSCFNAALSNYIENHWKESFHKQTCDHDPGTCAESEEEFYNNMKRNLVDKKAKLVDKNGDDLSLGADIGAYDLRILEKIQANIWAAAADMYLRERTLFHVTDDKGHTYGPPDAAMLADYRQYFDRCAEMKPPPWAQVGESVLTTRVHVYWRGVP